MKIKVTRKGNVKVGGVKYKAVPAPDGLCNGCVFYDGELAGAPSNCPPCSPAWTPTRQHVIFVRKAS